MLAEQKDFYERFYKGLKRSKTEKMKQGARLRLIRELASANRPAHRRILIAGCGGGEDAGIFPEKVIAFDLSFTAVKTAKQSFPQNIYLVSDAGYIPFKDNMFDCIICSEVIEHVPYPQKILTEFYRLLRQNGELILSTPNWLSWWGLARKLAEFILRKPVTARGQPIDNWYTLKTLQEKLEQNFIIVERRAIWYYPPTGRGNFLIPDSVVLPIFRFFQRLDYSLGRILPDIGGHIIAVRGIKNVS